MSHSTSTPSILAIVPAFNEAGNIRRTVEEIASLPRPVEILVIDDGSHDNTAGEACSAGARVISLPFNCGIGRAVQTGFMFAQKQGFEYCVQIDGDGQHDLAFFDALLAPLESGKADMAVGSRFIKPFLGYRSSFPRRIGIHFFAGLISTLTGVRVTDPTSGFRAFNCRAIRVFARDYPPDFPEPESIMLARRYFGPVPAGDGEAPLPPGPQGPLTVTEVPVQMRKRRSGQSSIRYLVTLYYLIKVTFAICLDLIKPRKQV